MIIIVSQMYIFSTTLASIFTIIKCDFIVEHSVCLLVKQTYISFFCVSHNYIFTLFLAKNNSTLNNSTSALPTTQHSKLNIQHSTLRFAHDSFHLFQWHIQHARHIERSNDIHRTGASLHFNKVLYRLPQLLHSFLF